MFIILWRNGILRHKVIVFCVLICFMGCGYRPMAYYANKALGDKVYVRLQLNLENTEESVQIKDIINEAIASRFHSQLTNENDCDTVLEVQVQNIQDNVIATNSQGFATFYRIYIDIKFHFNRDGRDFVFFNQGYYDYASSLINPIVTYNNRSSAILEASKQSIDKFISQVGYSMAF
ncbi:LPS assembly lipoprotein LptE [Helicobacter sp. MIT 14-3879]|uniref:LPS assembly lipoprotein LptE n=1 Tax=Helicobacter sp. MIT 14-3879 TaxID=2040649 RepID=UPI000E1E731B|nr:LPS assembly lipoprotein LptE [Helicobacter sp. MIT 14-3879]RDU61562.1 hypothetical protein CQA44_08570 [Helicobacter sp. MIT 14-3879]